MVLRTLEDLDHTLARLSHAQRAQTVIWLLCHYPDHPEMVERIKKAQAVVKKWNIPIWLFGSFSARYGNSVEQLIKNSLVASGVDARQIVCSSELGTYTSLDTVQELENVVRAAKRTGMNTIICISNPLQLLQVYAFVKDEKMTFHFVPSVLKDWRLWYVGARIALIPFAFAKVGLQFKPLQFIRYARSRWSYWPL